MLLLASGCGGVTGDRLLLIERPATGSRVGEIVVQAPLWAVGAVDRSGLRGVLELVDTQRHDTIALLNTGLRRTSSECLAHKPDE
jgi:hypothetical protein